MKPRQITAATLRGIPFLGQWVQGKTGDPVWIPERLPVDLRTQYPFHQGTWDFICSLVASGMTLTEIARHPGAPPIDVLQNWKEHSDESARRWAQARLARAMIMEEVAIEIATSPAPGKDEAAGTRAKLDAAKWSAEVGDRDTYGKSTKITGDGGKPTIIVVNTGIVREGGPAIELPAVPVSHVPAVAALPAPEASFPSESAEPLPVDSRIESAAEEGAGG